MVVVFDVPLMEGCSTCTTLGRFFNDKRAFCAAQEHQQELLTTFYEKMSLEEEDCLIYLTLGDGDFSFSLDLAGWIHNQQTNRRPRLVCTGLDSLTSLTAKYRDAPFVLKQLSQFNNSNNGFSVIVKHKVNAIAPHFEQLMPANIVIFNHPHLATENAVLHSQFLCHLFHAVSHAWMAASGNSIFVLTLAQGQYERWQCEAAARQQEMALIHRCVFQSTTTTRSYYSLRRHQTGKSFANRVLGASETFVFQRGETMTDSQWKSHVGWLFVADTSVKETQPYSCPLCDRLFAEARSVQSHIRSQHGKRRKESLLFACDVCTEGRVFESAEALHDHVNAKHRAVHPLIRPSAAIDTTCAAAGTTSPDSSSHCCPTCQAHVVGVDFDHAIKRHMDSFMPLSDQQQQQQFKCSYCNKIFQQDRARRQHENGCSTRKDTASLMIDSNRT